MFLRYARLILTYDCYVFDRSKTAAISVTLPTDEDVQEVLLSRARGATSSNEEEPTGEVF